MDFTTKPRYKTTRYRCCYRYAAANPIFKFCVCLKWDFSASKPIFITTCNHIWYISASSLTAKADKIGFDHASTIETLKYISWGISNMAATKQPTVTVGPDESPSIENPLLDITKASETISVAATTPSTFDNSSDTGSIGSSNFTMRNNVTDSQDARFMESAEREVIKAATDPSPATASTPISKKTVKMARRKAAALRAADEKRAHARSELQAEFRRHERDAMREDELQAQLLAKCEAEQRARDDPMVMIRSDDGKVDIVRRSQVWAVEVKYKKDGVQPDFKDLGVLSAEEGRRLVAKATEVNMIEDVGGLSLRGGAGEKDVADEGYLAPALSSDSTRKWEGGVAEKLTYAFLLHGRPITSQEWSNISEKLVRHGFDLSAKPPQEVFSQPQSRLSHTYLHDSCSYKHKSNKKHVIDDGFGGSSSAGPVTPSKSDAYSAKRRTDCAAKKLQKEKAEVVKVAEKKSDKNATPTSSKKAKIEYEDEGGDFSLRGGDEELSDDELSEDGFPDDENSDLSGNEEYDDQVFISQDVLDSLALARHKLFVLDTEGFAAPAKKWEDGSAERLMFAILLRHNPIPRNRWAEVALEMNAKCYALSDKALRQRYIRVQRSLINPISASVDVGEYGSPATPVKKARARKVAIPKLKVKQTEFDQDEGNSTPKKRIRAEEQSKSCQNNDADIFKYVDEEDQNLGLRGSVGGINEDDGASGPSSQGAKLDPANEDILMYILIAKEVGLTKEKWSNVAAQMSNYGFNITFGALQKRHERARGRFLQSGGGDAGGPLTPAEESNPPRKIATPKSKRTKLEMTVDQADDRSEGEGNPTPTQKAKSSLPSTPLKQEDVDIHIEVVIFEDANKEKHYFGLRGGVGEDEIGHENSISDCDLHDRIKDNRHRIVLIFAILLQGRGEVTDGEYERFSREFSRYGGIASADEVRAYLRRANNYVLRFPKILLTEPAPPPEPPLMSIGRRAGTPILSVGAVIVRMPNPPIVKPLSQDRTNRPAAAHVAPAAGPAESEAHLDPQARAHSVHQAAPCEYDGADEWEYDRGKGSGADITTLILFYLLSNRAITRDHWQQVADDLQKHGYIMTWNAVNLRYRKFKKQVLEGNPVGGPTAPVKRRVCAPKSAAKKDRKLELIVKEEEDSNEDPNPTPKKNSNVAKQTVTADHEDEVIFEDAIEEASIGIRGGYSGEAADDDNPPSGKASKVGLDQLMYVSLMKGRKITTGGWDHVPEGLAECGHTATLGAMKVRLHRVQHKALDRLKLGGNAQAAFTTPKKRRARIVNTTPKKAGKFKIVIKDEEVGSYSEEDVNPTPQKKATVPEQLKSVQYNDEDIFKDAEKEDSSLGLRGGAGGDDIADAEFELGHALDIFSPSHRVPVFSLNGPALQDDDEPAAASFHRNVGNTKLSGQGVLLMYVLLLKDRPITLQEWMDIGAEMSQYGYDVSGHTLRGRHSANKKLLEADGSVDAGLAAEIEAVESALLKRRRSSSSKAKLKEATKAKAVTKVKNDSEEDANSAPTKNSRAIVEIELDDWPYEDFPTPEGGYKWSDFGFVDEENSEDKRIRPAFGGDAANDDEARAASAFRQGDRTRNRKGNEATVLMYVVPLKNCTIFRQEWDETSTEMSELGLDITGNALLQRHNANRRLLSAKGAAPADALLTPKKRGVNGAKGARKKEKKPNTKVQARDEYSEEEDANPVPRKKSKAALETEPEPDFADKMSEGAPEQFHRLQQERVTEADSAVG